MFFAKKQRNFIFFMIFCQKMKKRDFRSKSEILGGHSNAWDPHSNAWDPHSNAWDPHSNASNWADFAVFAKSDKNFEEKLKM